MHCSFPFITEMKVRPLGERWEISYRQDTTIPRYSWLLLRSYARLLSFKWLRDRQRLQLLVSPGWNPAFTKARLVSGCIRSELSWPFTNSRSASTSIAHLSMKQDQVPIMQNKRSYSSQVKQSNRPLQWPPPTNKGTKPIICSSSLRSNLDTITYSQIYSYGQQDRMLWYHTVTPSKLVSANLVESLAIYPFVPTCDQMGNYPS
jgi:hypothetical protein